MGITSIRAVCVARCRLYWHCKITHWGANGSHIAPSTRPTLQINAKPPSLSCTSPGIVLSYITFNVMCFTFDKPVGATRALVCSYVPTSPLHARHASGALQYRGKNQWVDEAKTAASSRTKIDNHRSTWPGELLLIVIRRIIASEYTFEILLYIHTSRIYI